MNKKRFVVIGLLLVAVLVLASCAPQEEMAAEMPAEPEVEEAMPAEEVEEVEPAEEEMAEEEPMEAEESEMAEEIDIEALIAEKAAPQHELEFILGQEKTREEWEETIDRMIGYGAEINDEEKQLIIDYLVSRGSASEMDEMGAEEIDVEALIAEKAAPQHDLGFILGQEKTREEWETTIDRMIGYGAEINEEEKQIIIDYLVNR